MSKHKLLVLDFETYYDKEYSLKKMPTPSYILDPRFECIMVAVKVNGEPSQIIDGPDFPAFISTFDPKFTATVAFNALFDNCILAWRYGFVPRRMFDAMGMARALRGHVLTRSSLEAVSELLGLPPKQDALRQVIGMHRADIKAAGLWDLLCAYAKVDVENCASIASKLFPEFPESESKIMDMVLRCAVEPQFTVDMNLLEQHATDLADEKRDMLVQCQVEVSDLMSATKFAKILESRGVPVETKQGKSGLIPALAKSDEFMQSLAYHEDSGVQALAAARLGHKSTIEQTRTEKFLAIGSLPWDRYLHGKNLLPVALGYGKAHTHRLAGEWGMNMQNLPSGRGKLTKLRKSLRAPEGYAVLTTDLGQIEARLNAWFCGAGNLLAQFKDKKDPYVIMAQQIFGFSGREIMPEERFVGKIAILGLGYGCGKEKFAKMLTEQSRAMKITLPWDANVDLIAEKAVNAYRLLHAPIKYMWDNLNNHIPRCLVGPHKVKVGDPGNGVGVVEIGKGYVLLPNDMKLLYENVSKYQVVYAKTTWGNGVVYAKTTWGNGEWVYTYGGKTHKIYGAKLLENIIQALARNVVMNAALRIKDRTGYCFKLQAHDELVYIIPLEDIDRCKQIILEEMTRPPTWAKDLPLTASIGIADNYGDAK